MDQKLLTVVLLMLLVGQLQAKCPDCGLNARCVQNRYCVCNPGLVGPPLFHCHFPNSLYCRLYNDFGLRTFADERVVVNTLGSFRAAHLTTDRSPDGTCDIKLGAFTERIRGKIYVKGIQFMLRQKNSTGVTGSVEFRVTSNVNNQGQYQYTIDRRAAGQLNFTTVAVTAPTFSLFTESGCRLRFTITSPSRFLKVELNCCQFGTGFRPWNPTKPNRIPGMYAEVLQSANPKFDNWWRSEEPLCLDGGRFRISKVSADAGLSDIRQAMTFLSMTNQGPLEYVNAPNGQNSVTTLFTSCSKVNRQRFFTFASFIYDSDIFIRCFSSNPYQDDLFDLQRLLLKWFCLDRIPECLAGKAKITNMLNNSPETKCKDLTNDPQITSLVTMSCIP